MYFKLIVYWIYYQTVIKFKVTITETFAVYIYIHLYGNQKNMDFIKWDSLAKKCMMYIKYNTSWGSNFLKILSSYCAIIILQQTWKKWLLIIKLTIVFVIKAIND